MTLFKINNSRKAWPICQAFFYFLCIIAITLSLSACGTVKQRVERAQNIAQENSYKHINLPSKPFSLFMATPSTIALQHNQSLTIVIEGDGLAWLDRYTPSNDPTPRNPIGLKLATALSPQAIYLGRPCQYIQSSSCNVELWTDKRFDSRVINSYMDALDQIKGIYGNSRFRLVGFSGGAYVAFELSAQRNDIHHVTTIAGLLDPNEWTRHHKISSLDLSHTSTQLLESTQSIPFIHFCGSKDKTMPCELTKRFVRRAGNNHAIHIIKDAKHETLWNKIAHQI